MELGKYILKVLMSNRVIFFSWGFHNVRSLPNGLLFAVNGYVHRGDVEITYEEASDSFTVKTLNDDGSIKQLKEDVYISELADTVDRMVELCENYEQRVIGDYCI